MANYASNIVKMVLIEETTSEDFNRLKEALDTSEEISDLYIDWECSDFEGMEISFESRWTAPIDFLEGLLIEFKFIEQIVGVAYEWGNLYAESYDLIQEEE